MMGPLKTGGIRKLAITQANTNIVFDGNSLVEGNGASNSSKTITGAFSSLPPINGAFNVGNIGIGGQTIRQMTGLDGGSMADLNASFVGGKQNPLYVFEGTNSIANTGRTGLQAAADMVDYITAAKAIHPWRIILMTTIPRFGTPAYFGIAGLNAELISYNNYLLANYRAMGAEAVVDVRASGKFIYTGTTMDSAMIPYMTNDGVHCNDAGYLELAQACMLVARKLKA